MPILRLGVLVAKRFFFNLRANTLYDIFLFSLVKSILKLKPYFLFQTLVAGYQNMNGFFSPGFKVSFCFLEL